MSLHRLNTAVHDPERELRIARLRALESVIGPQHQVKFECLVPIYTAAETGNMDDFISALEKCSAEESASLSNIISRKGPSGNTLLHVTAGIKNAENILGILLEVSLDVTNATQLAALTNDRGDTALHVAARAGGIHRARFLLNFGSIVDKENEAGNTALHEAVKNVDFGLTDLLLRRGSRAVCRPNKENKSPLYLAVKTENLDILQLLMGAMHEKEVPWSSEKGMSPVHGAVMHRNLDMLVEISRRKKELFDSKDADENTPLHLAAYENYVPAVKFLVREFASSAFEHNGEGYLPIHVACKMGHLETIKVLRQPWPDLEVLTSKKGQNILHVAAKYGRASVVKYILGDRKLEKLINEEDKDGNTPVHVATQEWRPEVLLSLTRDNRVDLNRVNHRNFTALDIANWQLRRFDAPLHMRLTRTILVSAGAPKSKDKEIFVPRSLGSRRKPPRLTTLKESAGTRMLVATLITAMTFAAGFSVFGGQDDSQLDAGVTTLHKPIYDIFVICNSIAFYSSIIAVVILLWTQIDDSHAVFHALRMTRLPLLIALATMSVAFMAGVYVTTSKRTWIAIVILIVGITALFVILILYITLFIPLGCNYRLLQFFADYIIRALILISRCATDAEFGEDRYSRPPARVPYNMPPGPVVRYVQYGHGNEGVENAGGARTNEF